MKIILYKIKTYKKDLNFFYKLLGIGVNYYWIEYRIDEDRFWYVNKYLRKLNSHHTKQDCKGAINILQGIYNRSLVMDYKVEVILKNDSIIEFLDNLNNTDKNVKERKNINTIFLD